MKHVTSKFLLLLFVSLFTFQLSAQNFTTQYNKVTKEELELTTYDPDTTASAIVLYKKGITNYEYKEDQFNLKHEIAVKIKILKQEGVRDYADVIIPYYSPASWNIDSKENISGIEAVSYNLENGEIVKTKMGKEYLFKERVNEYYMQAKFSLPNVKVGTVLEYKYVMTSDYYHMVEDWEMQQEIPVLYSEYNITIPLIFRFNMSKWGVEQIDHIEKTKSVGYNMKSAGGVGSPSNRITMKAANLVFTSKDLPALKKEPFLFCPEDYRTRVNFEFLGIDMPGQEFKSFTSTWEDVDSRLIKHESFGKLLELTNPYREDLRAIGSLSDYSIEEKIAKVFQVLKQKIVWDGNYNLYGEKPEKILKKGTGSNADINFILIAMLKDAGILAFPVVMSKRDRGILPMIYPSLMKINTFVVGIKKEDGKYLFIDGSMDKEYINALPPVLQVDNARIVNTLKDEKWLNLTKTDRNMRRELIQAELSAEGMITGKKQSLYRGQHAVSCRKAYSKVSGKEAYIENLNMKERININNYTQTGINEYVQDIKEEFDFTKQLNADERYIYINPMIFLHTTQNPFIWDERKLPVEFPFLDYVTLNVAITLPEGYGVDDIPKSQNLEFADRIKCRYMVQVTENRLLMNYTFEIKDLLYSRDSYVELKDFWAKVVDVNNGMVVLKKL